MKYLFIIVLAIASTKIVCAQENYYSDAGMWNTFSVSKKLNSKFALLFTEEFRIKENFSRLNLFYTNLGVEYKINNWSKTSLVYRWIDKYTDENTFSFRNRIMWDISAKKSYNKFYGSIRHRLQLEKKEIFTSDKGYLLESFSRIKAELGYKIKKNTELYFSTESRVQINDPRNVLDNYGLHRMRYQAGFNYEINKVNKVGAYYLIQREFNTFLPENLYIIGLEYSIDL